MASMCYVFVGVLCPIDSYGYLDTNGKWTNDRYDVRHHEAQRSDKTEKKERVSADNKQSVAQRQNVAAVPDGMRTSHFKPRPRRCTERLHGQCGVVKIYTLTGNTRRFPIEKDPQHAALLLNVY